MRLPAETVIAGLARIARSFLLRSFKLPLTGIQPGAVVLSEQANEQGVRLIQILDGVLVKVGVNLDQPKLAAAAVRRISHKVGFWRLTGTGAGGPKVLHPARVLLNQSSRTYLKII